MLLRLVDFDLQCVLFSQFWYTKILRDNKQQAYKSSGFTLEDLVQKPNGVTGTQRMTGKKCLSKMTI